jgi:hypothetical protein
MVFKNVETYPVPFEAAIGRPLSCIPVKKDVMMPVACEGPQIKLKPHFRKV